MSEERNNNIQTNFITNYNTNGQPIDLPISLNQMDLKMKVPFDQKIMEPVWEYLSAEDKFNCTLVCKSFNNIISGMNCFRLIVDDLEEQFIYGIARDNIFSRFYKKVTFKNFNFIESYYSNSYYMVIDFRHVVTELKFINCRFTLKTFCNILEKFSLVESLELRISIIGDLKFNISNIKHSDLSQLTDLKIELFGDYENIFFMFFNSSNIQSLSINRVCLSSEDLDIFLNHHKSSLRSLTLKNCTFCFNNKSDGSSSFDSLHALKELHLIDNNSDALRILETKCIDWLSDLEVFYNFWHYEKEIVDEFFKNYLWKKEIYDVQLSKYGFPNEPSVTITKCPYPENIKTSIYHLHHCDFKYSYKNNEWETTLLTKPNKDEEEYIGRFSGLSIQVRGD